MALVINRKTKGRPSEGRPFSFPGTFSAESPCVNPSYVRGGDAGTGRGTAAALEERRYSGRVSPGWGESSRHPEPNGALAMRRILLSAAALSLSLVLAATASAGSKHASKSSHSSGSGS